MDFFEPEDSHGYLAAKALNEVTGQQIETEQTEKLKEEIKRVPISKH